MFAKVLQICQNAVGGPDLQNCQNAVGGPQIIATSQVGRNIVVCFKDWHFFLSCLFRLVVSKQVFFL